MWPRQKMKGNTWSQCMNKGMDYQEHQHQHLLHQHHLNLLWHTKVHSWIRMGQTLLPHLYTHHHTKMYCWKTPQHMPQILLHQHLLPHLYTHHHSWWPVALSSSVQTAPNKPLLPHRGPLLPHRGQHQRYSGMRLCSCSTRMGSWTRRSWECGGRSSSWSKTMSS